MNILFVTRDFLPAPGGIAIFIDNLADRLARRGHNVLALAPRRPGWQEVPRGNYTTVWCPAWRHLSSLPFIFETFLLANKSKADIIFLGHFMSTHGLGAVIAKRFLGAPCVFLTHGNDLNYAVPTPIDQLAALKIYHNCSLGLCNSRFTEAKLSKKGYGGPRAILHPGVDAQAFRPNLYTGTVVDKYGLCGKKVLLSVSRLVEKKNIDGVLRALPLVVQRIPNLYYLIVGEGPGRQELEELSLNLGISQYVRFCGPISHELLPIFYCASDLYVMPSHCGRKRQDFETFGISFLEASACGLPVLGSSSAGAAEAVIDGVTGLLADPHDTASIAHAILRVLSDERLSRRLGENGRNHIAGSLTWDKVAEQCEQYLQHALSTRKSRPK